MTNSPNNNNPGNGDSGDGRDPLEDFLKKMQESGFDPPHQNNGNIQERDYRVICERRAFEGNADFVKGKTVRLWLEETADDKAQGQ